MKRIYYFVFFVIGVFALLFYVPLSVTLTRDTIDGEHPFAIEVFEHSQALENAYISGNIVGESYRICGSAPYIATSSTENCKMYGFRDAGNVGCDEIESRPNSMQRACFKDVTLLPEDINLYVAGESVYSCSSNCQGNFKSADFSSLINNYCNLNTDFSNQAGECTVQGSYSGRGAIEGARLSFALAELKISDPVFSEPVDFQEILAEQNFPQEVVITDIVVKKNNFVLLSWFDKLINFIRSYFS